MVALKAYYDGKKIVPFQAYSFKPRQQVLIVVDENDTKKSDYKNYSQSLSAFRTKHADFLNDKSAVSDLDSIFDNVRDKTEPLRGSEEIEW